MKFADCNEHQKAAWKLMREIYNDILGGLENTLLDYSEDEEEYQRAKRALADGEGLLVTVYYDTQREATRLGFAKHLRFAGEKWLKERIARKLLKDGYYPEFVKGTYSQE